MWKNEKLDRIREFCLPDMPIIMFDVNEDFVVLTVEEVGLSHTMLTAITKQCLLY